MLTTIPSKKEDFERLTGFECIKEKLDPKTPMGQKYFKHIQPMVLEHIKEHLDDTEHMIQVLKENPEKISEILHDLECVLDISHTISRIDNKEILDEIELFELKNFVLVAQEIRRKLLQLIGDLSKVIQKFIIPDMEKIIDILDPEGLRLPTFYIYDAYDERLKAIRKKKREFLHSKDLNIDLDNDSYNEEILGLTNSEREIENEILEKISQILWENRTQLHEAFEKLKYLDIILAKAMLSITLNLTRPEFTQMSKEIKISGMFNPRLKAELESTGKHYQPVDISLSPGVTVIVGANMSGKSVILRTLALIHYMSILGFFVPAESARIPYIEAIALITEDSQRPLSGLSSFASEIKLIDEAYQISQKRSALVLIDEPARTTNPYEGSAIVNAIVECFEKTQNWTVVVTHFDDIECKKRYRVKGLKENVDLNSAHEIQELIDYELIPDDGRTVPKEALRVMELLNVNKEIIAEAKKRIRK
ncbi:lysine 5,6-aminomutase reactivase ATPase KamC [Fervidobacterium sp.]